MYAKIKEDILEVKITYQEMLPLVLKHVEAVTSCGKLSFLGYLVSFVVLLSCHYLFFV